MVATLVAVGSHMDKKWWAWPFDLLRYSLTIAGVAIWLRSRAGASLCRFVAY